MVVIFLLANDETMTWRVDETLDLDHVSSLLRANAQNRPDLNDMNRGIIICGKCDAQDEDNVLLSGAIGAGRHLQDHAEDGRRLRHRDTHITYFDTVPVASSMCVLKTGLLFVACEFSNQ